MNNQPNYDMAMGFLQIFDVLLNLDQVSNDTIFEELQKQDKEYLEKIIKQNEKIIEQNNDILNYCDYIAGQTKTQIDEIKEILANQRSKKLGKGNPFY